MATGSRGAASRRVVMALLLALSLLALGATSHQAQAHSATPSRSARPATANVPPPTVTLHYHSTLATYTGVPYRMGTDADGNLYVSDLVTEYVYVYNYAGSYEGRFGAGTKGSGNGQFNGPEGVAVIGSSVYVVDFANNRIEVFNRSTGAYMSQFANGLISNAYGMTVGSNGNLYVSDAGHNRIVEFTPGGSYVTAFGALGTGNGQFNIPAGIAASSNGMLVVSDAGNNRVEEFTLDGTYVTQWGSAYFKTPDGIAVDRANMVYVVDAGNGYIRKFDLRGVPTGFYGAANATPASAPGQLSAPGDIAVPNVPDSPPIIYVSDANRQVVYRFDSAIQPSSYTSYLTFGSRGSGNGQFLYPEGIAVDSQENVYVADGNNSRIEKFDQFGNFVQAWSIAVTGDTQFVQPFAIVIDDHDNIYVTDVNNCFVLVYNTSGELLRRWGSLGNNPGQFNYPVGLGYDGTYIYVADGDLNSVQKFTTTGTYVSQWGSLGTGNGQFQAPSGLAVDRSAGEVFVADYNNHRVETFDEAGHYESSWTLPNNGTPADIATDQHGNVYVTDSATSQVLQYDAYGDYIGAFGSIGTGTGQFTYVAGIAIDPRSAQIWVCDNEGYRVQRFGYAHGEFDTVGVWRPSTRTFYLKYANSTGPADLSVQIPYAQSTDIPVVGDWNGDSVDGLGVYRSSTGTFYLQDALRSQPAPDYTVTLGTNGDTPLVGDWTGSGFDGLGIFRPSNGLIYIKNQLSSGYADETMVLGVPGDHGVAGDWNGDGQDSPGVYRPSNQTFYLSDKVINGVAYADHVATLGISGDAPFTGDWISQGSDGIGVFRVSNGVIYLKNQPITGFADSRLVFGIANDVPVAGVWQYPGTPTGTPPRQPASKPAPTVPTTGMRTLRPDGTVVVNGTVYNRRPALAAPPATPPASVPSRGSIPTIVPQPRYRARA